MAEMSLEPGSWVVTNPPYGIRVGDEETYVPAWLAFRDRLQEFPGTRVGSPRRGGGGREGLPPPAVQAQSDEQRIDPLRVRSILDPRVTENSSIPRDWRFF